MRRALGRRVAGITKPSRWEAVHLGEGQAGFHFYSSSGSGHAAAKACARCSARLHDGQSDLCRNCQTITAQPAAIRALGIMYHDVVHGAEWESSGFPGASAAAYKLEAGAFEHHLESIQAARGSAVSRVTDPRVWESGRPVFLTFDDGGSSAYELIAPALEARNWRGHFFITTDWIGRPGFLTEWQIRDLRGRGHLIGSHSCSHPLRMSSLPREKLVHEWRDSIRVLSEILQEPVWLASVPGGGYSRAVAETAAAEGILTLFTSEPTMKTHVVDGCLVLGRYFVQRKMPPEISGNFAAGRVADRLKQAAAWKAKKAVKAAGGSAFLQLREFVFGLTNSH